MKKYLFIALAALGFAACSEKFDETKSPSHNGEIEESYIAINLMAADSDTRAQDPDNEKDGGYEYGTDAERAVKSAYFFFFDENGNPFNVVSTSAPGGDKNHLPLDLQPMSNGTVENVSDISQAVLILNTYKGVHPKQVVAVLNWAPNPTESYSLDRLHETLAAIGNNDEGYVMSNSVYMNGSNEMVDAVAISSDNIKTDADQAKSAPIDIYVERIAAKVSVTAKGGNDPIFKVTDNNSQFEPVGGSAKDVYMEILGWELFNDYKTTNLIKNIDTAWTTDFLGLNWNDSPYYRCYWATSQSEPINDEFNMMYAKDSDPATTYNGFPTAYGYSVGGYTYCGENTNGEALRTKLIIKGQLKERISEDPVQYQTLEIASWYGNEYAGEEALKTAVVNSLKYTLLYLNADGTTYSSIGVDDIVCVKGEDIDDVNPEVKAYHVGFQLSTIAGMGEAKTWYLYDPNGNHTPMAEVTDQAAMIAATNAHLAQYVEPALLYNDGQTYYIVDIEHLGADKNKPAYYGVVRNHVYEVDINSIKGYGSPVYDGLDFTVEQPEYPEEYDDTYVAAKINVLAWKIVKQTVDIVQ
ncbi:MAG: Mfa1 fimbrilin C-terminal domain-containing protein [Alistipes sp.]|nr:Mfa1 fimbrilin C-terminal domain-containing protein [Alistipes sp.]